MREDFYRCLFFNEKGLRGLKFIRVNWCWKFLPIVATGENQILLLSWAIKLLSDCFKYLIPEAETRGDQVNRLTNEKPSLMTIGQSETWKQSNQTLLDETREGKWGYQLVCVKVFVCIAQSPRDNYNIYGSTRHAKI